MFFIMRRKRRDRALYYERLENNRKTRVRTWRKRRRKRRRRKRKRKRKRTHLSQPLVFKVSCDCVSHLLKVIDGLRKVVFEHSLARLLLRQRHQDSLLQPTQHGGVQLPVGTEGGKGGEGLVDKQLRKDKGICDKVIQIIVEIMVFGTTV